MSENELRQERAALNQSLFRDVNERLLDLHRAFVLGEDRTVFICECARMDCVERIDMPLEDYGHVRGNPRQFFVAPSEEHVLPEVEHIIAMKKSYWIVEKIEAAAEVAERMATA